ncbi:MAG TPA: GNAT family N-acetyltransferase [Longimicrobium sp.]
MPAIRRLRADEWRAYRDLRLRALGDSPDAFASVLETQRVRPDSDWQDRLAAGAASPAQLPLVAEEGDALVGLVWGVIDPPNTGTAHVIQMWVAPEARGRGVGAMLLDAVVAWARDAGARGVMLDVTCGDSPARRLYERAGFVPAGDPEPLRAGSDLLAQPMRLEL